MLQTDENETEILLGNKQLIGIFLVIAILLGFSFTGGFLVGRGSAEKKAAMVPAATAETATTQTSRAAGQTHTLEPEGSSASSAASSDNESTTTKPSGPALLGSRKKTSPKPVPTAEVESKSELLESEYTPQPGSEYLQVAAVSKDEAETVADVLHKKGFHAHAVPKPGNAKIYRVIIGPVKDAGDLSSTRDALRKTFREVIVQRY